ncbi:MAG: ribonuclease III, partial [Selenomonadaceae bacterium]|nr:ribonuclease III [Selenomonadaceae bacterium]
LYKHFPNMSEGELTKARAALVCQDSLSKIAEKLGFGQMLIVGHSEDNELGRSRPSTLEDAFEAMVGALYLDRGWRVAKKFVEQKLKAGFADVKRGRLIADPKSHLQELIQREQGHSIEYVKLKDYGPDHDKTFECAVKLDGKILGRGVGKSKQSAEKEAANQALKFLENEQS